jgi:hypothetical protein
MGPFFKSIFPLAKTASSVLCAGPVMSLAANSEADLPGTRTFTLSTDEGD